VSSGERVDEWVEEVKTSAEEGDWEVKKVLEVITESMKQPSDVGNLEFVNILHSSSPHSKANPNTSAPLTTRKPHIPSSK
jgi:hypothetical protein